MGRKTLVMYEISQKQNYIFRTNRLIENIGASTIIRQLTEEPHQLFKDVKIQLPNVQEKLLVAGMRYSFLIKKKMRGGLRNI